ncbi:hypothetical protein RI367_000615 [Sorochytrium milnesiophthora]
MAESQPTVRLLRSVHQRAQQTNPTKAFTDDITESLDAIACARDPQGFRALLYPDADDTSSSISSPTSPARVPATPYTGPPIPCGKVFKKGEVDAEAWKEVVKCPFHGICEPPSSMS